MLKPKAHSILIISLFFLLISCKENIINEINIPENNGVEQGTGKGASTTPVVVTDDPKAYLSYDQLSNIEKSSELLLRVNRNEFEVWEVPVLFDGLFESNGEKLILCHTYDDFKIGGGDSGSPLLTKDGEIIGILCYGYYGNSNDFIARAIEDVISIDSSNSNSNIQLRNMFEIMTPVNVVSGFDEAALKRYSQLNSILKNVVQDEDLKFRNSNSLRKISEENIIPGASIMVQQISGDFINSGAVGTVSYIKGKKVYAFGHQFMPFLAAPTYLASTKSFIKSSYRSFKMSQPTEQFLGSFTQNDFNGILINKDVEPKVIDITTSCEFDDRILFSYNHQLSNSLNSEQDKYLATDLSCYLIYLNAMREEGLTDSINADCTLKYVLNGVERNIVFSVEGEYVDWMIYDYIYQNVTMDKNSILETFNLSVLLRYDL